MTELNDLPKMEEKILKFWKDRKIFERSLENRKGKKRFVFFEGPPTANAKPGMHHLIGRVFKDLFTRYKTMAGYYVQRKGGWDTHGLPVEIEVEKELGLKDKKAVQDFGIGEFNKKARQSVWKYKEDWEKFTERTGFWLDLKNPYITYDWKYMETLWWIIGQIDKQRMLYLGHKVLPWCPRCGTALSSHEVAQEYRDVTEASVYVKFKILPGQKLGKITTDDKTYALAWTTTPWTLPGNVALAVGKNITYIVIKRGGERLIAAKNSVGNIKNGETMDVEMEISGKYLIGLNYAPLFDIEQLKSQKSYKIYPADFVTTEEGTGIVHTAVMYGEDDYELGKQLGLPAFHTVDESGKFTADVKGFEGRYVKEADRDIIKYLGENNALYKVADYTHSYPFCWRCKNPLLYYAKNSWFVAMSKTRKKLLKNNSAINWIPDHLKEGRFGEFLNEVKDWAFSRERFWGTPLPIWECNECGNHKIVSSIKELDKNRYGEENVFYILRHGLSEKNGYGEKQEVISSRIEHDKYNLLPEGIKQIEKAGAKLKKTGGVDMIFASPFLRTKHTADIIGKMLGVKVNIDDRLKELDHGSVLEGKPYISFDNTPDLDTKRDNGESRRDAKERMFSLVQELNSKYQGKKILIVSHGDPIWLLEGTMLNFSDEELAAKRSDIYHEEGELKKMKLSNYSYDKHGNLDLHRPYIDEIYLKCQKCKGKMGRVKEVADVWFDSGSMPFAQWHYPFENKQEFDNNFPADFISEGIDQTRGWFYTLLAISTLLGKGTPYKNVLSYNHVLDKQGKKMSKTLGNAVNPWDIIEKFGADAARWYFYSVNNPSEPKLFDEKDVKTKMNGFIMTLVNSLRFIELYSPGMDKQLNSSPDGPLDKWILSRLNRVIAEATLALDSYNPTSAARTIEDFVVSDLSNWWLRRSRNRFQKSADKNELDSVAGFYRFILSETAKIIAPFIPFISDHVYKRMNSDKESVHMEDWPVANKNIIDDNLESSMLIIRGLAAAGLAQRKEKNIKVRQPLAAIFVRMDKTKMPFQAQLEKLLKDELNIKKVIYKSQQDLPVVLDTKITPALAKEGMAREIIRCLQDMRKEIGYKYDDKIEVAWHSESKIIADTITGFEKDIKEAALINNFDQGRNAEKIFDASKEFDLGLNEKIWLGIKK